MKSVKQLIAKLKRGEDVLETVLELQRRINPDVVDDAILNDFIAFLEHENPMIRESAAVALGNIDDPRWYPTTH